jgi:hypothetical protein
VDDPRQRLSPYVRPDEQLLWCGQPDPAKKFTGIDVFMVPFSLLWGGFAIFWMAAAVGGGAPLPFALFGLPFVAVGLYFIFGRFVVKARRKRQTAYGLTERRALVAVGDGSLSESPVQHQPINQHRSRDGKHINVIFGRSATGWFSGPSYANTGMEFLGQGNLPLGFYDVADVAGLTEALRRIRP